MQKETIDNHKIYLQRLEFYRGFGYDLEKERDFIVEAAMPLSGRILEIGTGKGHFALALAKKGLEFTTLDISDAEQEIARLNLRYHGLEGRVKFVVADAAKTNFPDASFEAILSINVFHHLADPKGVLNELVRILHPRGKIVLGDFTEQGLEIINSCHTKEGRHHDHFKHHLKEAENHLSAKGFKITHTRSKVQEVIIAHH